MHEWRAGMGGSSLRHLEWGAVKGDVCDCCGCSVLWMLYAAHAVCCACCVLRVLHAAGVAVSGISGWWQEGVSCCDSIHGGGRMWLTGVAMTASGLACVCGTCAGPGDSDGVATCGAERPGRWLGQCRRQGLEDDLCSQAAEPI